MKKLIIFLALSITFSSCATSKKAIEIRTKLATDTKTQLIEASKEVSNLINYIVTEKTEKACIQLKQKYDKVLSDIQEQYIGDQKEISEKSALAGQNYIIGIQKIKEDSETEISRLIVISQKIDAGARAVEVINSMATEEASVKDQLLKDFFASGIPEEIEKSLTDVISKYYQNSK